MQEENTNNATTFVVDASFVLALLLPDERVKEVDAIFDRYTAGEIGLVSIELLPFEVANSLVVSVRRKRITTDIALKLLGQFIDLAIPMEPIDIRYVCDQSITTELTVYDAAYSFLAKLHNIPLLTLDASVKASLKKL